MNPVSQILVTITAAAILSIVTTVIGQAVLSAKLNQRMDDNDKEDDRKHRENRDTLKEIRDDVKRINGTVGRHDSEIKHLRSEWDRRNGGS